VDSVLLEYGGVVAALKIFAVEEGGPCPRCSDFCNVESGDRVRLPQLQICYGLATFLKF
jgi:hypothetical protein